MKYQDKESFFIKAYDESADAIFRFCYFKLYDRDLSKDVVQETFMRTWVEINKGKEFSNIRAFLFVVAGNLVKDYWKKKKAIPFSRFENEEEEMSFDAPDEKIDIPLESEVKRAISYFEKLSEPDREVLALRFVEGFSPKEIAQVLKERENTISVRLNRAVERLRNIIGG